MRKPTACTPWAFDMCESSSSHVEVLRFRLMHDNRAGALLRIDLPVLGEHAADALRLEQSEEFFLIGHIRARRIAEAVTRAAVVLGEQFANLRRVFGSNPQLRAHALVP